MAKNELKNLTARELATIKKLVGNDKKLSAAFTLSVRMAKTDATRLAKTDSTWRTKANAVGRDFVKNRRALGKVLDLVLPHKGGRPTKNSSTVLEFGIDHATSSRAQILAKIPEQTLNRMLREMQQKDIIQVTPLYNYKRVLKEKEKEKKRKENQKLIDETEDIEALIGAGLMSTIVIDPPWDFTEEGDIDVYGLARPDYVQMSDTEIQELPVNDFAADDCHLYLWITNRSLLTGKAWTLCEAWGFRPITILTWCKPTIGVGNYFRNNTEHCIFGVRGQQALQVKNQGTWFEEKRGKRGHSSKPDSFFDRVEKWSPGPYLRMFWRGQREGWTTWGAEA